MVIWECEHGRLPSLIPQVAKEDFIAMDGNVYWVIITNVEQGLPTIYLAPDPEIQPDPKFVVKVQVGQDNLVFCTPINVDDCPY